QTGQTIKKAHGLTEPTFPSQRLACPWRRINVSVSAEQRLARHFSLRRIDLLLRQGICIIERIRQISRSRLDQRQGGRPSSEPLTAYRLRYTIEQPAQQHKGQHPPDQQPAAQLIASFHQTDTT